MVERPLNHPLYFYFQSLLPHPHTHVQYKLFISFMLCGNKQRCTDIDQINTYDGKSNILTERPLDVANGENKKSMLNNHSASK